MKNKCCYFCKIPTHQWLQTSLPEGDKYPWPSPWHRLFADKSASLSKINFPNFVAQSQRGAGLHF